MSRSKKIFISLHTRFQHDNDVVFDTLDSTLNQLKLALHLVDSNKKRHFVCVNNEYRNTLLNIIASGNFGDLIWNDQTTMMYLEKENALRLEINIPDGIQVHSLLKADADKVNSIWPHASPGSEKFFAYIIEHNPNVGVYNEKDELLAWCLFHDFGCFLALQTDPNHLRKGYGELAAKALSKKIAEDLKLDCVANVFLSNEKSINLFTKIGFQMIGTNSWIGVDDA